MMMGYRSIVCNRSFIMAWKVVVGLVVLLFAVIAFHKCGGRDSDDGASGAPKVSSDASQTE